MNRRSFLLGSASVLQSLPIAVQAQWKAFQPRLMSVVVTDVDPGESVEHLLALLDPILGRGLPVTCVVDPLSAEGKPLSSDDDLAILLAGLTTQSSSFRIAPYVQDLMDLSSYFQARRVRDAIEVLQSVLYPHKRVHIDVVAGRESERPTAPTGLRATGAKTVLTLPEAEGEIRSEAWPEGVVRFYGGQQIDIRTYSGAELRADPGETQSILYISAEALHTRTVEAIAARSTTLAEDLIDKEKSGRSSLHPVSDLQLRDNYAFERFVAVHLMRAPEEMAGLVQAQKAFMAELRALDLPYSLGDLGGSFRPERPSDYWVPVSGAPDHGLLPQVTRQERGGEVGLLQARNQKLPPGHSLAFSAMEDQTAGFDQHGVLWLPVLEVAEPLAATDILSKIDPTKDMVLSIQPSALAPAFARTALVNQLKALVSDGVTRLLSVQQLARHLAPKGPEVVHQRRTTAYGPEVRAGVRRFGQRAKTDLLEDAKIAWQYFEDNTIAATGLCPATINFSPSDGWVHQTVTMWDVGSHINALVAAAQLGLIDQLRFDRNIGLILKQIRGRESQGRLLPQGWIRVDRQKWGNKNFDGSDAGRLLSSLHNLRQFIGKSDQLQALIDSWDLDQIIINGEVHSVTDGSLHSVYRSHSAHYSARAFGFWGVEAKSPYDVSTSFSTYDDQMALLEAVSWIGPLGAEPLLLEGLEQGMSAESAYLADVLFAAQLEEHEETGRLVAVSEGPIDVSPWFTYQGLQMDAETRTWALDTVGSEPKYADPEFWRENLVVSSKAAFLWSAFKPHEYSEKLLAYVRQKARTKRGFASSIFSQTGRVTATYTDLNTNAVILQAVAKMLTTT